MATTTAKNGLPLIDSSMTADVPRDMNALANAVDTVIGDMHGVPTASKEVAGAIGELFTSVGNGKNAVAAAITDKGVSTSPTDTFATMAANIGSIRVGIETGDASAVAGDVRAGKTAYARGAKVTGTLPVQATGAQTITPGTADVVKGAGIYDGAITVKGDANLASANIKAGKSIFGVAGSSTVVDTADAVLDPAMLVQGYSGYDDGVKKAGTMLNRTFAANSGNYTGAAGFQADGGGSLTVVPQRGYYEQERNAASFGPILLYDANYVAANILAGKSIFGVAGTAIAGARWASGQASVTEIYAGAQIKRIITVAGLNFTPKVIICENTYTGFRKVYYGGTINGDLNVPVYSVNTITNSDYFTVAFGTFTADMYWGNAGNIVNWIAYE